MDTRTCACGDTIYKIDNKDLSESRYKRHKEKHGCSNKGWHNKIMLGPHCIVDGKSL